MWLVAVGLTLVLFFFTGGRGLHPGFAIFLGGGLFLCSVGAVIAFLDLRGINAGRVNPDGYTRTLVGGWLNGFTVLLYWCVIGYCIFSGL
jgi:hypothetical protein